MVPGRHRKRQPSPCGFPGTPAAPRHGPVLTLTLWGRGPHPGRRRLGVGLAVRDTLRLAVRVTPPPGPEEPVPVTWVRRDDPAGFSLSLPSDRWQRSVYGVQGGLTRIDCTPGGGTRLVRVAVDTSPDYDEPCEHQLDLEAQLRRPARYERVTMERNVHRDRGGSLWELHVDRAGERPRRLRGAAPGDRGVVPRPGRRRVRAVPAAARGGLGDDTGAVRHAAAGVAVSGRSSPSERSES
ncbi:hypothetical protein GCM10020295_31760 [Streptomyces cinereospinus]